MKKTLGTILLICMAVFFRQVTAHAQSVSKEKGIPLSELEAQAVPDVGKEDATDAFIPFEIAKDIIISQPLDQTQTTAKKISILGAADPSYPLFMNGTEVKMTKHGFFSRYVDLAEGENIFVLQNNNAKKSLTIIKNPTGYRTTYSSSGATDIIYDRPVYGIVNREDVTQRSRPAEAAGLPMLLAKGTTFKILGENGEFYKIEDGTYIYKISIDIYDGELSENTISRSAVSSENSVTTVRYAMNVNALYGIKIAQNKATLLLRTVEDQSSELDIQGTRISQVDKTIGEGTVTYTFSFMDKPLGHSVRFFDGEMIIDFRLLNKDDSNVLAGARIILDAGHGQDDPGAKGPLFDRGPVEKDFNLRVTHIAKDYLESRGAKVQLIRADDTFVPLSDRAAAILEAQPDISVSIHTNAMPITADFNETKGSLMFFYYNSSWDAATHIHQYITQNMNMVYRPPVRENFALTRISDSPAILFEMGYVTNPDEYEWLLQKDTLERIGKSLGEGIEDYLRKYRK